MKLKYHKSKDASYKFAFWDRIRHHDGTRIRQIRWGRNILSFIFSPRCKPDVEAGKTLEEAATNWDRGGFSEVAKRLRDSQPNREIKFRVWDKTDKCFIKTNHVTISMEGILFIRGWSVSDNDKWVIQQYIGLKDSNERDIYEGDIVKFEHYEGSEGREVNDDIGEVLFNDGMFCFKRGVWWATNDLNFGVETLEVVGNIFENPELLKFPL